MMRIEQIFLLFVLIMSSCDSGNGEIPAGPGVDSIKLSAKEVSFTSESNSVIITTEGTSWWINSIRLNDELSDYIGEIDTTQDNFLIEASEFTIERRNGNQIHISMAENQSDTERTLNILLQAGNYFDGINVTQSGN